MKEIVFPLTVCQGFCGVGKASFLVNGAPFFYGEMFSSTTDPLWSTFSKKIHFQPAHIFPSDQFPFYEKPLVPLFFKDSTIDLNQSIQAFHQIEDLQKVVLAAKRTYSFDKPIDLLAILSLVIRSFPKERVFAYMPNSQSLFFGVTPENLFHRSKKNLIVDCIAGTVLKERERFLLTPKLMKEHQFVVDFVEKKLSCLITSKNVSPLGIKEAAHLSHLYQTISGTLLPDVTDQLLIRALHPTPATLGFPSCLAQAFLKKHEPFERGYYCGIMGWMTEEETTLKVCLRSALAYKNTLTLFAGAGITSQSLAEEETSEIHSKFNTLEEVLFERTMSHK